MTNNQTAPEPMTLSDDELIYQFGAACARNSLANRETHTQLRAELKRRLALAPEERTTMPEQTARISASNAIAVAVVNWLSNRTQGPPSQAVLSALTEAGLCIVEREDVAKAADAVLDLMSRREMQAFRHEWVDVHRRMTAAVATGVEG